MDNKKNEHEEIVRKAWYEYVDLVVDSLGKMNDAQYDLLEKTFYTGVVFMYRKYTELVRDEDDEEIGFRKLNGIAIELNEYRDRLGV